MRDGVWVVWSGMIHNSFQLYIFHFKQHLHSEYNWLLKKHTSYRKIQKSKVKLLLNSRRKSRIKKKSTTPIFVYILHTSGTIVLLLLQQVSCQKWQKVMRNENKCCRNNGKIFLLRKFLFAIRTLLYWKSLL